ncbi:inositol monophosphatase family protein [Nitrosospira sp. Nsp18]|uniref:inositol monophosphatase family protein n=1 Tax=Nitrosospira sp. Nsp18 TaxID=1855334 RepID=UPI001C4090B1|nr:inositol monophosphatase family protein [Nitrosospira sp. Nsp18]
MAFAQLLADIARPNALRYFRAPLDIMCKADRSPVTAADHEIESALRQVIHQRYPHHAIIGEEYGKVRGSNYSWILDPIDGTKSFVMGNPLFGTLIGLMHEDETVIGLIDVPAMGEQWAGDGEFTRFNNRLNVCSATVSGCHLIERARLYATPSPHFACPDERNAVDTLSRHVAIAHPTCDCYAYGLLASGYCDLIVETGLQPYDYLPVVPIVEGAGGWITDWKGRQPGLNSDGRIVAAASKPLLDAAIDSLMRL